MVESQTFVSRRRHPVGRRPRKLFTARGMVKEGEVEETSIPYTSGVPSPPKMANSTHVTNEHRRSSEAPHHGKGTRDEHDRVAALDSSNSDNTRNEEVSSHFDDNNLENALQMGCMDGMLFSGTVDDSRIRNLAVEQENHKDKKNGLSMPQLQNFIERLSPTQFDMRHILPSKDRAQSKPTTGFTCQMPYQNFRDQISEDHIFHGNLMMYQPGNPVRQFDMTMRNDLASSHFVPHPFDPVRLEVDAPPTHIFIGEQPCFSEDLIPVDDMPPPGSSINLTKYHPKPLIHRPDGAFDKPMFSIDSDDSSQGSEVSEEKKLGTKAATPRRKARAFATKPILSPSKKTTSYTRIEDDAGPSFDKDEGISIDKPPIEQQKSPSFQRGLSVKPRDQFEESRPVKKVVEVVPSSESNVISISSMDAHGSVGGSSIEESAASDEAITSEMPKPKPVETLASRTTASPTGKEVSSSSVEDQDFDSMAPQDENGGPSEKAPVRSAHVEKVDQYTERRVSSPRARYNGQQIQSNRLGTSSDLAQNEASRRRKPLNLMVATNVPVALYDDDGEYFSPKGSMPRSFASSPRKTSRNRGKSSTPRIGPDESFDEEDFFDTAMA